MNLKLNIYDKTGKEVIKTVEADTFDLMFGTIVKLMDLLKLEDIDNNLEILKVIYGAWNEITDVLSTVFPSMTDEDWKTVKVKELIPVIIEIGKFAIADALAIPTDSKN